MAKIFTVVRVRVHGHVRESTSNTHPLERYTTAATATTATTTTIYLEANLETVEN